MDLNSQKHQQNQLNQSRKLNEEKIDRRIHWAYWAIVGIAGAAVWCCKLEFTVAELKKDMDVQIANRNEQIAQIWNRFGADHDMLIRHDEKLKSNESIRAH